MLRQNIELSAKKNAIHEDISAGAPYAAQLLRWGRTRPGLSLYKKKQHPLDTEERIGYFTNPKDGFGIIIFSDARHGIEDIGNFERIPEYKDQRGWHLRNSGTRDLLLTTLGQNTSTDMYDIARAVAAGQYAGMKQSEGTA